MFIGRNFLKRPSMKNAHLIKSGLGLAVWTSWSTEQYADTIFILGFIVQDYACLAMIWMCIILIRILWGVGWLCDCICKGFSKKHSNHLNKTSLWAKNGWLEDWKQNTRKWKCSGNLPGVFSGWQPSGYCIRVQDSLLIGYSAWEWRMGKNICNIHFQPNHKNQEWCKCIPGGETWWEPQ